MVSFLPLSASGKLFAGSFDPITGLPLARSSVEGICPAQADPERNSEASTFVPLL